MRDMPVLLIFRWVDLLQVILWVKCVGELSVGVCTGGRVVI
jgi:hypothetical protein